MSPSQLSHTRVQSRSTSGHIGSAFHHLLRSRLGRGMQSRERRLLSERVGAVLHPLQVTQETEACSLIVLLSRLFRLTSKVFSRIEMVDASRLQSSL